jgi:hypothetical protein
MAASSLMVPLLMIVVSRYLFELVPNFNIVQLCLFWGSCSSVTEDLGLLVCDAAPLMFQRQYNLLKCLKLTVHWQSVIYLKTLIFEACCTCTWAHYEHTHSSNCAYIFIS